MYLAHISEDNTREQSILEHGRNTAELAGSFSDSFGCKEWGYGCGFVHDIGKYSAKFQQRLHGGPITDHAGAGAQELFHKKNLIGAYCVAAHHSGLMDGGTAGDGGGEATFFGRMKKELEDYQAFQEEIEIPDFPDPPLKPLGKGGFSLSFFIRMVFSCLVDADFLDTEDFMSHGSVHRDGHEPLAMLYQRYYQHVEPWLTNCDRNTVNGRRSAILKACFAKGEEKQGIYTLTVPTGGGKTLSSLAFALQQAKKHHLKRIIYVIPYTSIIEQNAQVFREILGSNNVLEDHCNVSCDDEEELQSIQLASENWDRPVVVTTNVQFFESLYANRTSKCRKLHNIAESVIIFDEVQMLPVPYLHPCIRAIDELVYNYRCTAVLCTATQPAFRSYISKELEVTEICPAVKDQYEFFRRSQIITLGELSEESLIEELKDKKQVLCILNSRKRVQRVYEALTGEGTYHLSTLMYPKHRRRLLKEIRKRLKEGQVCRLIATSLVEAGVDFDFITVYRELAGIDSVIQASGRCNREGKRPYQECKTVVFTLNKTEGCSIAPELKLPISVAEQILTVYEDIGSPEAITEYFKRLYHYKGEGLDAKHVVEQLEGGFPSFRFPFRTVAEQFHIIENRTKAIVIDQEPEAAEIVRRLRFGEHSRQLMREAGQFVVNVYDMDFENLMGAGRLEAIGGEKLDRYVLRNRDQYTEEKGLALDVNRGDAVFF